SSRGAPRGHRCELPAARQLVLPRHAGGTALAPARGRADVDGAGVQKASSARGTAVHRLLPVRRHHRRLPPLRQRPAVGHVGSHGARREDAMRVLQVGPFPPPYGGVERNLVAIRTFLRNRRIPCGVNNITRHRPTGVEDVYQPAHPLDVMRLLATQPADVIHIHFGGMITTRLLCLYLFCSLLPGRRTVLTFHSGGYPTTPEGRAMNTRSFAAFVFWRLDRIIAVNTEIEAFFHRLGVEPSRVTVIAPHAFVEGEGPSAELPASLAEFAAANQPLMVSVGGLEPEYDVPAQIELLGRV